MTTSAHEWTSSMVQVGPRPGLAYVYHVLKHHCRKCGVEGIELAASGHVVPTLDGWSPLDGVSCEDVPALTAVHGVVGS